MPQRFFREFLRNPRTMGAVFPSSAGLAREIVSGIGLEQADVVAEYGPGTGAFTGEILSRMPAGACYFAVERNARMAEQFGRRFPGVRLFEDSVENVPALVRSLGSEQVDCIVCGLPWAAFPGEMQDRLMAPTLSTLRPGGAFATFAYLQGLLLPAGQRFQKKLHQWFARVEKSPVVWRNLPPAFVYRCYKADG